VEAVRTGRERLEEWVQDIQSNAGEVDSWFVSAEEWADRIMEDINRGIITAEVDG
jgi:hypothetical protein